MELEKGLGPAGHHNGTAEPAVLEVPEEEPEAGLDNGIGFDSGIAISLLPTYCSDEPYISLYVSMSTVLQLTNTDT